MSTKTKQTELSGMLSETVSVKKSRGKVVVANHRPKPRQKPTTERRAAHLERFREAVQYAKQQTGLEASRELYLTGVTGKMRSAHIVAMSDYLVAPQVHYIDAVGYRGNAGDAIAVKATDDFMVTGVRIVISAADGTTIEEGEAGPDVEKINIWTYKASVANPSLAGTVIRAIAVDRPGNLTSAEKSL